MEKSLMLYNGFNVNGCLLDGYSPPIRVWIFVNTTEGLDLHFVIVLNHWCLCPYQASILLKYITA